MDRAELLALMDLNWMEMMREMMRATPGGFVVERGGLVMCGSPRGTIVTNCAMVAGETDTDTVRAETRRVYAGLPFSIVTRDHADAGLQSALAAAGCAEFMNTPAMAFFAGDGMRPALAPGVAIRPVADDAGRAAYAALMAEAYAVYGTPRESTLEHFARLTSVRGPTTQAFLVWRDGHAVGGAILYLSHGVGGVGWVGALPAEFGRGYGPAATWAVVDEGLRRGVGFMNLQASPMGAPVYRRMGFATPTHYRAFIAPE